jgi:hypothetical protein
LDLDDPQSIFAFTSRYGPLGGADAYAAIPLETDPFFATLYGGHLDLENERAKKRRALWREVTRADPSLADREPIDKHGLLPGPLELALMFPRHIETLDEFRFAARCIRDITTAWRNWREGSTPPTSCGSRHRTSMPTPRRTLRHGSSP